MPEISVIMAVYNTERYLKQAVQSILSQSYSDFELIVVDDGSTDSSPDLLRELVQHDVRIKLVHQPNAGIGAATTRGIKESTGQYIAIMDSDDVSLPNRLALQKQYLDCHPEIDGVGSQWRMMNADGSDVGIDMHPTNSDYIGTLMYAYYAVHHPTCMVRRTALEKVGGYSADRSCLVPDYDVFMRMQQAGCQFANLSEVLFLWRLNPTGTTHSKSALQTQSVIKVRDWGFEQLIKNNPNKAFAIAKTITYNAPTGYWQDRKIRELFPNYSGSLLYKTWESLTPQTETEELNRAVILWLRDPVQQFTDLHEQLTKNQLTWLASLLKAFHGYASPPDSTGLQLSHGTQSFLSIFIPFTGNIDDFHGRIEQAIILQKHASLPIQILAFSGVSCGLSSFTDHNHYSQTGVTIIDQPNSWERAFSIANGQYFSYLEENFRIDTLRFSKVLTSLFEHPIDSTYLLDDRYFLEAIDDKGRPSIDDSPSPKWTRNTLLGRSRLNLSGFLHTPALLNDFNGNFPEYQSVVGIALARHLAAKRDFSIVTGVMQRYIPKLTLSDSVLFEFKHKILTWYYDYGVGGLPCPDLLTTLSQAQISDCAKSLSDAWIKKKLLVYLKNMETIKRFYIEKTSSPLNYALFREILIHNKRPVLTDIRKKSTTLNLSFAIFYCIFTIIRNRF